jgi:hypothetical protein
MKTTGKLLGFTGLAVLGLWAVSGSAEANTLALSCQVMTPDPNAASTSCPASAPTYLVPGQYTYDQSFSNPEASGAIIGSNIYGGPMYGNLGAAGFVDDYFFQITPAQADVVSATISLGDLFSVDTLFARIYSLDANPGGLVSTGVPNGPVLYGTMNTSGPVSLVQINPVMLTAGSYVLEISGVANGTLGGSYTGTLNFGSPVPLPAGLPLLLTGIATLAGFARRRLG